MGGNTKCANPSDKTNKKLWLNVVDKNQEGRENRQAWVGKKGGWERGLFGNPFRRGSSEQSFPSEKNLKG